MGKGKPVYKSFTDKFGEGEFFPDAPKVEFAECINKQFVLKEAKILRNFQSEFGKHDAALLYMVMYDPDAGEEIGEHFTTINSGQVVVERISRALKEKALPLLCTPVFVDGRYYNLL